MSDRRWSIRTLQPSDVAAGLALSTAAGWNQTERDWQRLVDCGDQVGFAAVSQGRLVGSVTTIRYGGELAWIGMMLVHADHRGQGIARALMTRALQHLDRADIAAILLDATPMGQPLYEQLGFVTQWSWHRWARAPSEASRWQQDDADDLSSALELDRRGFGADRSGWLRRLAGDSRVVVGEGGVGMLRPGLHAWQLGPLVAQSPRLAERLAERLLATVSGACVWDVAEVNPAAAALADRLGFQSRRVFSRMLRGHFNRRPQLGLQYAIGDPATG